MSNTKIEFHVLQSFPPANLNRDDTNTPKDCEFGGVRRARVSSQCIKRSIRLHPDFATYTGVEPGERTRWLVRELKDLLVARGKSEEEASEMVLAFVSDLLGGMDAKKPERTKVLFFIGEEEKQMIVDGLLDEETDKEKLKKEFQKTFSSRNSTPDIALFGRMLADDPKLNLEASCQVAHAISTHRVNMEMDFFTAVDDLLGKDYMDEEDQSGAGMMGITGFNSATFYRYAAIDWGQLLENLGGDEELAEKTVRGFTYALAKAIPTGKQNSFAAQTPPAFVMAVVRQDGQAWSLANAFEKPIRADRAGGYLAESILALDKHWAQLNVFYGDADQPVQTFVLVLDEEVTLANLQESKVTSVKALAEKVAAALPQE